MKKIALKLSVSIIVVALVLFVLAIGSFHLERIRLERINDLIVIGNEKSDIDSKLKKMLIAKRVDADEYKFRFSDAELSKLRNANAMFFEYFEPNSTGPSFLLVFDENDLLIHKFSLDL